MNIKVEYWSRHSAKWVHINTCWLRCGFYGFYFRYCEKQPVTLSLSQSKIHLANLTQATRIFFFLLPLLVRISPDYLLKLYLWKRGTILSCLLLMFVKDEFLTNGHGALPLHLIKLCEMPDLFTPLLSVHCYESSLPYLLFSWLAANLSHRLIDAYSFRSLFPLSRPQLIRSENEMEWFLYKSRWVPKVS